MASEPSCACCGDYHPSTVGGQSGEMTCYCPLDGVIDIVAKKYTMQVVALLGAHGPMRYTELETSLDASSPSTLSGRLDQLERADLIERRSFDEIPPRVEYSLTPRGRELEELLQPLLEWAARHE